jgi:hypothetical protein
MAVKGGQILHDAYGFIIDRIQTGGATGLNIPEEKVYEVGNFEAVGTTRDAPDLSFGLESWDASTELEALLTFLDPTTAVNGDSYDLSTAVPMDITSPIKDAWRIYQASRGVVIPYLSLESSRYRFELRGNASQQHTLRGDSYFFVDGSPRYEEFAGDGSTPAFNFTTGPALPYRYEGEAQYVLGASVVYSDRTYKRLFRDTDFTDSTTAITLIDPTVAPTGSTLRVVYGNASPVTMPQRLHATTAVKPAALRGRNIDVYIGDAAATPTFTRWTSVQSAEVNFTLTLDKDEEFGNPQAVAQDHDVPEVAGNVVIRPRDTAELWDKVFQVTNVAPGEVAGPLTSVTVPMEIRMSDPDTGARLKTLYIPDAQFKPPAIEGRVQAKQEPTFEWTSLGGNLTVYKGNRYGT